MLIFIGLITTSVLLTLTAQVHWCNGVNFSRAHVGVWFDPWVSRNDIGRGDSYTVEELIPMVEKISSKFSTIMIREFVDEISDQNYENDILEIPTAVAQFNKKISGHSPPPLELIMRFRMDDDDEAGNDTRHFDAAKRIADGANSIHPNTVRSLLVVVGQKGLDDADAARAQSLFSYYKNMSSAPQSKFPYKLGLYANERHCGDSRTRLPPTLLPLLPFLEVVYIFKSPKYEDYKDGLDSYFGHITSFLDNCKKKLTKMAGRPDLEVGFASLSLDTTLDGVQNIPRFASYWERIGGWARSRGSKVVMVEAFDNPWKSNGGNTLGWWRLVENSSYLQSSDFLYEDKGEVAAKERAAAEQRQWKKLKKNIEPVAIVTTSKVGVGTGGGGGGRGGDEQPKPEAGVGVTTIVLASVGTIGVVLILFGISIYFVYLKVQGLNSIRVNGLADEEIQEFYQGAMTTFSAYAATAALTDNGYDTSLELAAYSFEIDEQCILGSGAFGTVFRGRIMSNIDIIEVAVKTTKPSSSSSCPASAALLKGLLCEIKIMAYIGTHENVVSIVGAYTAELHQGKVYVFTELCSLGSLEGYLRKIDRLKLKMGCCCDQNDTPPHSGENPAGNGSGGDIIEMSNLGSDSSSEMKMLAAALDKWAYEIARGMEYLASKHIVHADLATRNVLLTDHKTAKISDFGLSRRLYDYTNYVKTGQEPLPWRWMSPESLRRLVFNEKSDVWSFGITLSEIFSLGDIPYAGMSWSVNWVSMLTQGLRPAKPAYDLEDRYSAVLQKCWAVDPEERPSFSELKAFLQTSSSCSSNWNNPEGIYMEV